MSAPRPATHDDVEWLPCSGSDAMIEAYVGAYLARLSHDGDCWTWRIEPIGECDGPNLMIDEAWGLVAGSLGEAQRRSIAMARALSTFVEGQPAEQHLGGDDSLIATALVAGKTEGFRECARRLARVLDDEPKWAIVFGEVVKMRIRELAAAGMDRDAIAAAVGWPRCDIDTILGPGGDEDQAITPIGPGWYWCTHLCGEPIEPRPMLVVQDGGVLLVAASDRDAADWYADHRDVTFSGPCLHARFGEARRASTGRRDAERMRELLTVLAVAHGTGDDDEHEQAIADLREAVDLVATRQSPVDRRVADLATTVGRIAEIMIEQAYTVGGSNMRSIVKWAHELRAAMRSSGAEVRDLGPTTADAQLSDLRYATGCRDLPEAHSNALSVWAAVTGFAYPARTPSLRDAAQEAATRYADLQRRLADETSRLEGRLARLVFAVEAALDKPYVQEGAGWAKLLAQELRSAIETAKSG